MDESTASGRVVGGGVGVIGEITVEQLAGELADGAPVVLLDVRQPWEHELAALPNSVLIPLNELAERASEIAAPTGARLVAYCHHGIRSRAAAALLAHLGLPDAVSLAGGIEAWSLRIDPTVPRY